MGTPYFFLHPDKSRAMAAWAVIPDIHGDLRQWPQLAGRGPRHSSEADIGRSVSFRRWRLTPGDPSQTFIHRPHQRKTGAKAPDLIARNWPFRPWLVSCVVPSRRPTLGQPASWRRFQVQGRQQLHIRYDLNIQHHHNLQGCKRRVCLMY